MCRTGGRRCPSYSDPAAIAARNARRRVAYAARRSAHKAHAERAGAPEVPALEKQQLPGSTLGVRRVPTTGGDNDELYCSETIVGVVNHQVLTTESYKEFGFEDPREDPPWQRFPAETFDTSVEYLRGLPREQRKALNFYTGKHFRWINKYAYHPELLSEVPDEAPSGKSLDEAWDEGDLRNKNVETEDYSRALLEKVTGDLDAALAQAPKRQKHVYRGLALKTIMPERSHIKAEEGERWARERYSLGTELIMDGYASTSTDFQVAGGFGDSYIVYEMLTSEGAPVNAISALPQEEEVLLPRKQRYMVVGMHHGVPTDEFATRQVTLVQLVAINERGEVLDGSNEPGQPELL